MTTDTMPPLVIEAKGEIITSNFSEFAAQVRARLREFNAVLRTDQDFAQAEQDSKLIKAAEESLAEAKAKALASAEDLRRLFEDIDDLSEEMREARLALTRQIVDQKTKIKTAMVDTGLTQLICDPSMRLGFRADICGAMNGKRTVDTLKAARDGAVKGINARIKNAKAILDAHELNHGTVHDRRDLECSPPDAVAAELRRRIEAAAAEKERRRLQAEAQEARREADRARADAARAAATATRLNGADDPAKAPQEPTRAQNKPLGAAGPDGVVVPPEQPDRDAEWSGFTATAAASFADLKCASEMLTDERNKSAAKEFRINVNLAWSKACHTRKEGA